MALIISRRSFYCPNFATTPCWVPVLSGTGTSPPPDPGSDVRGVTVAVLVRLIVQDAAGTLDGRQGMIGSGRHQVLDHGAQQPRNHRRIRPVEMDLTDHLIEHVRDTLRLVHHTDPTVVIGDVGAGLDDGDQIAEDPVDLLDTLGRRGRIIDARGQRTIGNVDQLTQSERHILVKFPLGPHLDGRVQNASVPVAEFPVPPDPQQRLALDEEVPTGRSTVITAWCSVDQDTSFR